MYKHLPITLCLIGLTFCCAPEAFCQDPVDCTSAIPICNSQQLNYNSNGAGINDFGPGPNNNANGCLSNDEHQSAWFQIFISPSSPPGATLAFTLSPTAGAGEDYDFALYGPNTSCGNLGSPIRCSYAASNCGFCPSTGMGMGATDFSEGAGGDGFVAPLATQPGQSYILLVDNWLSSSQGFFLDWTGTAILSCACSTTATITGNLTVCPGQTTTLTANGTNLNGYIWAASAGGTITGPTNGASITAATPGTYTVTVSDAAGCTGTAQVNVTLAPTPTLTSTATPATCGQSNGAINLTVSGGTQPYTFNWSNGATIEDPNNLPAGNYTVTVTGANGCTATASATVPNNSPPITVTGTVLPNTTCLSGDGSITTIVVPSGTYTYLWSNGATSANLSNLPPGNYQVTVTGSGSCTGTASFTVPNQPNVPMVTSTTIPTTCGLLNGQIDLTVSGGTAPYSYLWSNGATNEDLAGVLAGNYTVTVTAANGCTATAAVSVANNNPPINVTATVVANTTCNGGNGGITTTVTPTPSPSGQSYTYNWSNGETTPNLSNLPAGSYTVTVSSGGSCTQTATFTIPNQPNPPVITSTSVPTTCGLSNGSVDVTVSGGVSPYTFLWSNGPATEDLANIPAGNYALTVTGANGCTATTAVTVANSNPPINITGSVVPNTTCNGGNGSITTSITPAGAYTINWSNGGTTPNLDDLPAGSYTVTVSAGGACSQTATFTIPNQPNPPVIAQTVTPATCGLPNGSINVTVSGGLTPYVFAWSNGSNAEDLNNLTGGSYSLTVTGANGCAASASIAVPDNPVNFTITPTILPNTSCLPGSSDGSISIVVAPTGTYTFTWSTGATGTSLTNLPQGSYTVTVSAGGTCTQAATFNVPNSLNAPTLSPTIVPASCGLGNGAATIVTSGGLAPFTYVWSNGGAGQSISNVPGGNYAVTVTGANGCTAASNVAIPNNNIPINISQAITPNTSCAAGNGAIALTVTPGGLTYAWSNGATTSGISNLDPGTYTVTVSAGGTCTTTASFTVPDDSAVPNLSITPTATTCNLPNGAADLAINGGIAPFLISWTNGATSEDLSGILAGTYSVVVTSAGGCLSTATVNIPNNNTTFNVAGVATGNSSCSQPNGTVQTTVTPPGSYTYLWSTNETDPFLLDVPAGTYTVTVSAGGTCTQVAAFQVFEFAMPPSLSTTPATATCGLSNGSINLTPTGGTAPYGFVWSNGATSEDLANVPPGNYGVTITDANFCTATTMATVGNNNPALNISGVPVANTSCISGNGGVNISITPAGNYTYIWSNGAALEDLGGVTAGIYAVTVSAGGNCSSTASFTVSNNTQNPLISENITAAICGESNGGIDLSISGATPPYSFVWSNGATSEDLSNLPSGDYVVTVSGVNGCSATASFNVPNNSSNFTISGTPQPVNTCIFNNGSINLNITPAGAYSIVWSNGATSEDLDSLAAGTYSVTVTESGSCSASAAFTIANQTSLPTASQTVTQELCGLQDGAVDLTVSGGTLPYTFVWSNGALTEDLSGLSEGAYTVTVTGANGCSTTASASVPGNSINFSVNGTTTANTLCGANNGSIDISISPAGTYNYSWSNGTTTEDLNGLTGGSYTVTVSAGGSCTTEAIFQVGSTTADPVISQTTTPAVCGESNGAINVTVSGGVSPFTYLWSNGQTVEDLANLAPGNYTVSVTGANGCASSANFTVPNNSITFTVNGTPTANTFCTNGNGGIDLSVTPAGNYTFTWSNGTVTEDLTGLAGGSYDVTVSAGGTCTSLSSFTVPNNPNLPSISQTVTAAVCGAPDGGIDLSISGGTLPYSFSWSNAATTEDLSGIISGNYAVTVTAANGCSATGSYSVPNNSNTFTINGLANANTLCAGANGGIDLSISPASSYSFVWSNGETTEDLGSLLPGNYTVTVSDGGTCTASATFAVGNGQPTVTVSGIPQDISCFGENSGAINLTASGGSAPYLFDWSPAIPGNPEDPSALSAGDYNVVVTDASGCSGTAGFTLQQPASAVQLACHQTGNVSLPGASDGAGSVDISGGVAPYGVSWTPGGTQANVQPGSFNLNNLGEGNYAVVVTDANGCTSACNFTITTNDCVTALGSMGTTQLSLCGDGCQTATYNPLGQYLDPDDVLQYILHTGNGNTIVNEIARSSQPTFCFDPATMNYGTVYYISAAAGDADAAGNVILSDACTQVSVGTPIIFNEIPQASIAQPAPLNCLVSQVALTGSSSIPGSAFGWATNGGSIIGNPAQATVQAGAAGTYTLTVSANGCSSTAAASVVDQSTDISASITSSPGELLDCTISQITLTGSATGSPNLNFVWLENGIPVSTNQNLIVDVGGMYNLIAYNPLTGCADTTAISISDNTDYPPITLEQPQELNCLVASTTLSGTSDIAGVQFTWATINGGDTVLLGTGNSYLATAPGTYYLLGVAPNGCENGEAVTVTGDFALPTVDAGENQTLDCVQTPVQLTGSSSPGVALEWTTNNPTVIISNPNSPVITVNTNGVYTLTVTDLGNYCTDADDVEVFQYTNQPQGTVAVEPPTCYGDGDGAITVMTDPADGPYQFALDGQGNSSSNYFAPLAPGNYQLVVTDGQGCTWSTEVYVPEPEPLTVELGANLLVQLGETATLQVLYTLSPSQLDTILWTPAGLADCQGTPCDEIAFSPTEQTEVGVTVIDTNGCRSSDDLMVFVKKERHVYVPNSFSPNGDGTNDVFMIYAGAEAVKVKEFLVFDRWGETVFQYYNFFPNDPAYGWDGTYRAAVMDPAVFVWFAVVEFVDGQEVLFEGDVTLMK
ncbi:MAG: gliding motility-associated C-terminal domain-containing protein [Lewinellaceae bacterium]|nr:gliding motility-associated C-terminal domain-containing protein [Saprospiraceae bacterium]MCB9336568.1 gliding motility-associated C-terminal domain-containing protein [Lewinellaceae bacterium]